MKEIYSDKIFNWTLITISILVLIDSSYLLSNEFEYLNVLILRITLTIIPILSLLSFFINKLNKELFSRLFILANLIFIPFIIYFQFLVDATIYSITRLNLISNPILHTKFLIGLILFYLSIKYSHKTRLQKQNECGIIIIIYGFFLIVLTSTKIFDYDFERFSIIEFLIKLLLIFGIIFIGNKLRINKQNLKKSLIITGVLATVCALI